MSLRWQVTAPTRARALARGWTGAGAAAFIAGMLAMTGVAAATPEPAPQGAARPVPQWLFAIGHAKALAVHMVSPASQSPLTVTSPAFHDRGAIPCRNTQYCGNIFPGLAWSAGPAGTRSYVVVMQGPGEGTQISLHLVVFNVPASVRHLAAGMTGPPAGASLGPNVHGLHHTCAGPHPHDGGRNEYHLQVFALDATLDVSRSVTFDELIAAMKGHVLAAGQLVGFATQPASQS